MRGRVAGHQADDAPRFRPQPEASSREPAPVSAGPAAAPGPALAPGRIVAMQRLAGNRATAAFLQRQATASPIAAPIVRPTLRKGDTEHMVGVLQQKLSALGEQLVIDAEFGGRTDAAVRKFQNGHGLKLATGVADGPTWAQLDTLAPGGVLQADGTLTPVKALNAPDSNSPSAPDSDIKPVLRLGSRGVAIAELHQKLNPGSDAAGGDGRSRRRRRHGVYP